MSEIPVPALSVTEPPSEPAVSESSAVVRIAIAVSVAVHLAVMAAGLGYAGLLFAPSEPEQSIAVDLVTPQEVAEISKPEPAPVPDTKPETKLELPSPAMDAPKEAPAPAPKPDVKADLKLDLKSDPKPDTPPIKPPEPLQATSSPLPDSSVPPMPPPDLTVKYNIDPTMLNPSLLGRLPGDFDGKATMNAGLDTKDIQAFRAHLKTCSTLPAGINPDDKMVIVLRALFQPDGRLSTAPILIEASASSKGPLLMQAAIAALQACQPHGSLPADKYKEWKMLDLSFTPQDFRKS
jgi:hypothetical protein